MREGLYILFVLSAMDTQLCQSLVGLHTRQACQSDLDGVMRHCY